MAQDVHSTRDVMKNQDYGLAPSIRFGIGQPTEVTFNALLMHNHDMPDYGLPPVNGAPAAVNRKNFYGATDDRTIQDVVNLNATITHRFNERLTLRNQTQYSRYRIDARESGPNNVGTLVNGAYTAFPATNLSNTTLLPLDVLYVGLGSHDRDIQDSSFYNQTDLIAEFATGQVKHQLLVGFELGEERNDTQNYTRNIPGNPNNYFRAVSLTSPVYAPAGNIPEITGNVVSAKATDIAPYINDTISFVDTWKAVAGVRYDRYEAKLTNSINLPASASQTVNYTSVRAGLIYQPTDSQSYYVSYGTSFNPSLETLALTNGQQSLDPETSRQYELGAKWVVARRQPVGHRGGVRHREGPHALADLARGVRAHRQHPRARLPGYRRRVVSPTHGRCSAATPTSTRRSCRRPCSTRRRARCPPTRRRTALRCGPRTTSRASGRRAPA